MAPRRLPADRFRRRRLKLAKGPSKTERQCNTHRSPPCSSTPRPPLLWTPATGCRGWRTSVCGKTFRCKCGSVLVLASTRTETRAPAQPAESCRIRPEEVLWSRVSCVRRNVHVHDTHCLWQCGSTFTGRQTLRTYLLRSLLASWLRMAWRSCRSPFFYLRFGTSP